MRALKGVSQLLSNQGSAVSTHSHSQEEERDSIDATLQCIWRSYDVAYTRRIDWLMSSSLSLSSQHMSVSIHPAIHPAILSHHHAPSNARTRHTQHTAPEGGREGTDGTRP
mmetsp:Transcript_8787/g.25220  ORF Transcript_8787/g.25220 Transcript_8787/m.25220 type:complete len:111 (-) Transcript_8787:480-812(-)